MPPVVILTGVILCAFWARLPGYSERPEAVSGAPARIETVHLAQSDTANTRSETQAGIDIPRGTILPVQLSSSLSSAKSKPGQRITGKVVQDVPLAPGKKIPKGSKVVGQVIAVTRRAISTNAEISFRFDELRVGSKITSLATNLRAIAGFIDIDEAQIPVHASGESEVYDWLPTKQVGGDDVFGRGGPVTKWKDSSIVVGTSLMSGGVLVRISARPELGCRGPLYGNDVPQALWVFSSDACGVYGIPHLVIADAGRDSPRGVIVLGSSHGDINLRVGTGMLLRVNAAGN